MLGARVSQVPGGSYVVEVSVTSPWRAGAGDSGGHALSLAVWKPQLPGPFHQGHAVSMWVVFIEHLVTVGDFYSRCLSWSPKQPSKVGF